MQKWGSLINSNKEEIMIKEIKTLVEDLGWEYDRMSSSGQETYDALETALGLDKIPITKEQILSMGMPENLADDYLKKKQLKTEGNL
jgi:hypothetical protein|tara:strand:+ start:1624 stop:1884 length:261 start_codon:yes stop_codon:yes gene_type:complete